MVLLKSSVHPGKSSSLPWEILIIELGEDGGLGNL